MLCCVATTFPSTNSSFRTYILKQTPGQTPDALSDYNVTVCLIHVIFCGHRIHSFMLDRDGSGAPCVWFREHDCFEKYLGDDSEGSDDNRGLRVFKTADGKCPLNTVRGVQLLYNEHHPAVKAKTDDLTRILQRFGQDPELEQQLIGAQEDDSHAGVRLQMVRDLIIRRQGMAEYYRHYDDRMKKLHDDIEAGSEPRAAFQLRRLPSQATPSIPPALQAYLEAIIVSASRARAVCASVDRKAAVEKASREAAMLALAQAADVSVETEDSRAEFRPENQKRLRFLGRGGKRMDRVWRVDQTRQGEIVLIKIDSAPGWGLGVALSQEASSVSDINKQQPALFRAVVDEGSEEEDALKLAWLDAPPKKRSRGATGEPLDGWQDKKLSWWTGGGRGRSAIVIETVSAATMVFSFRTHKNTKYRIPPGPVLNKVMTLTAMMEADQDAAVDAAREVAAEGVGLEEDDEEEVMSDDDDDVIDAQAEHEPLLETVENSI